MRPNTPTGYEPNQLTTKDFATIPTMSSGVDVQRELGHKMAETSLVEKVSYLQSQMHFDESMESTADSDLEDEELQKVLTLPLYAQRTSGKPAALFSPKSNEQRNQMWSSVFGNANLSNLSGTRLEGNKDHLLNQARSDLAKRELHVETLNECLGGFTKTNGGAKHGTTGCTKRIC